MYKPTELKQGDEVIVVATQDEIGQAQLSKFEIGKHFYYVGKSDEKRNLNDKVEKIVYINEVKQYALEGSDQYWIFRKLLRKA